MKRLISLHIVLFWCTALYSQVEINHKLIFTSADSSQRNITGLSHTTDSLALVPVITHSRNKLLFSYVSDNDTLSVSLPITQLPVAGFGCWILSSLNTSPTPVLTFDNNTFYPVVTINGTPDSVCIKQNYMAYVIYNGTSFVDVLPNYEICPSGFVSVSSDYCIEINENSAANFWSAVAACHNKNAELCTWGEWYYACQKTGLGLTNMTNNWEWANSASNHATATLTLGNGGCQNASESNTQVVTNMSYRCCYNKK